MRKILCFLTLILSFIAVYFFREDLYTYYYNHFVPIEEKVTTMEKNNYYRNYDFSYVKNVNSFIPEEKQDILNIYYTVVNSGMDEFTFYCPTNYTNCINDVNDLAKDQTAISTINNFVHPYNSFKTLKTEVDSRGKITIKVEKIYNEEMIIILNYKVDEILKTKVDKNDDTRTKIKKIHDYIINNTVYDKERSDNQVFTYNSSTAYGVLIEGYGICGGYTDTMELFLEKLGIKSIKISNENHIWNYVYLNNQWLHMDLTWDDPILSNGKNMLDHTYFLINTKSLKELENNEHNYNADIYK